MSETKEVVSMFMPLQENFLVLPNASVAEVVMYQQPLPAAGPKWLLGKLAWRGLRVPMISFEAACGRSLPIFNADARIAIVYSLGKDEAVPYMAILVQSSPKVTCLNDENAQAYTPENDCEYLSGGVISEARIGLIPNLDTLEAELRKLEL